MARPQKDIVDYFPHDANASSGDTLTVLQARFGNDGYAFWFKLLEKLASSEGHYLDFSEDHARWQLFLARCGVNAITGTEILNLLVEMNAIDKQLWLNHGIIWCQKLVDNIASVYNKRGRAIPIKPVSGNRKLITAPENPITGVDNTQSKLKYSKVEETKEESSSSCMYSNDLNGVKLAYSENIGELTEIMETELKEAIKLFSPEWVIDAIKEAVIHGKPTWVYTAGVLKNWARHGREEDGPRTIRESYDAWRDARHE